MAQATTNIQLDFGFAERVNAFVAAYRQARLQTKTYNETLAQLTALSNRDLADIGLGRGDLESVARAEAAKV